jgi:hypothetical protein
MYNLSVFKKDNFSSKLKLNVNLNAIAEIKSPISLKM